MGFGTEHEGLRIESDWHWHGMVLATYLCSKDNMVGSWSNPYLDSQGFSSLYTVARGCFMKSLAIALWSENEFYRQYNPKDWGWGTFLMLSIQYSFLLLSEPVNLINTRQKRKVLMTNARFRRFWLGSNILTSSSPPFLFAPMLWVFFQIIDFFLSLLPN